MRCEPDPGQTKPTSALAPLVAIVLLLAGTEPSAAQSSGTELLVVIAVVYTPYILGLMFIVTIVSTVFTITRDRRRRKRREEKARRREERAAADR